MKYLRRIKKRTLGIIIIVLGVSSLIASNLTTLFLFDRIGNSSITMMCLGGLLIYSDVLQKRRDSAKENINNEHETHTLIEEEENKNEWYLRL